MPKKFNKKKNWNRFDDHSSNYSEHDNRTEVFSYNKTNPRKVSFESMNKAYDGGIKKNINSQKGRKDWEWAIKKHLQDEDIDMGGMSSGLQAKVRPNKKYGGKHGGGGGGGHRLHSPAPRGSDKVGDGGSFKRRKLLEGPTNWYRVTMHSAANYDKEYIVKILLGQVSPDVLVPINWKVNGYDVVFYLDEYKIASKLFHCDKKLVLPDGRRLSVKVYPGIPNVEINDHLREKMKLAMAKRYNPATKALDLMKFHLDDELRDTFCALFRSTIMMVAVDVIASNIPDLEALNLSYNRLYVIEHLNCLAKKLPALKILHIGNNNIRDIKYLDALKGLNLIDLVLDGNPLCDKFKDQNVYVSEVRKRFPKVIKLDAVDLPPPILFDVTEESKLPPSIQTYLCNDAGGTIVRTFLEQYFIIYDSANRQPLLHAYHENAMYSMTMGYPIGQSQKNAPPLNWYLSDNRNLLRIHDLDRRSKLLRQGQLSIISYLTEMPKTQHDMNSFKVDLSFFTPQFMMLTVCGIFKEIGGGFKVPPIRAFNRVLIIVAVNSGFCIANEQIHITNANEDQVKEAFKSEIVTPTSPQQLPSEVSTPQNQSLTEPDDLTKQQMVHALSQQSGMNIEFSTKCLQETNWDFQRAAVIFTELQKQNGIPPEAFVK